MLSLSGFSQTVLLQGKIITAGEEAGNIHIINITKNTGTTSDVNGNFEIRVNENDTLLFTGIQYERQEKIISEDIFKDKFIAVVLKEAVNQMDEVNLSNLSLTGRLNTDLDQIKTFNKYNLGIQLNTVSLPSQQDRRIYTASSSSLDLLINVLSGRLKKLKKEQEVSRLIALVYRAEKSLPEDFFTDNLELSENDIVNFLYFCAEQSGLKAELDNVNKLDLMEYFQEMKVRYQMFLTEE